MGQGPSTVNQPFNQQQTTNLLQNQIQQGNLTTSGQTTQQADPLTQNMAANVYAQQAVLGAQGVPTQGIADLNAGQQSALTGIWNQGMGLGPMVGQGAEYMGQGAGLAGLSGQGITGQDVASFYNPMAGNITAQLQNIFGQQNAQTTANATRTAGGVGASRIGVAQANLANQQTLGAGQIYAGLYQNALQAAQQQKQQQLQSGMGLGQFGMQGIQTGLGGMQAAYQAMTPAQQLQQQALNAQYQQAMQQWQVPWQRYQAQVQGLGAMGVLGGTATQTGTQTGTQQGILAAQQAATGSGLQSTQYPAPSLASQIAGFGGLGLAAAGMFLNKGGAVRPKYPAGGVVPYAPIQSALSPSASMMPRPQTTPGPKGPVQTDFDAITGDITKYSKLGNLFKRSAKLVKPPAPQAAAAGYAGADAYSPKDLPEASEAKQASSEPSSEEAPEGYQDAGVVDDGDHEEAGLPEYNAPDTQDTAVSQFQTEDDEAPEEIPLPRARPEGLGVGAGTEAMTPPAGLTPRVPGGGGGLGGGMDPRKMALIQTGLAMAAASGQRDRHGLPMSPLAVIGQGGMAGMGAYQQQQKLALAERQRRIQEQNIQDLMRHRLEVEKIQKGIGKPVTIHTMGGPISAIQNPDGSYTDISTGERIGASETSGPEAAAPRASTGAFEVDPSASPTPPQTDEQKETAAAAMGGLTKFKTPNTVNRQLLKAMQTTPEQFDFDAVRLAKGDTSVLQGRGTRQAAQMYAKALRARANQWYMDQGLGPEKANAAVVEFGAMKAGARSLATQEGRITGALARAEQTADVVTGLSDKIDRTEYPTINKVILAAKAQTGDENVVRYGLAMETFILNYASATGQGNSVLTDTQRLQMEKRLQEAWSKGQVRAVIDQAKIEMNRELSGVRKGMGYYLGTEAVTPKGTPESFTPTTAASPAKPIAPPLPSGIPAGSLWSPSRKMWKTPDGKLFNEKGEAQ